MNIRIKLKRSRDYADFILVHMARFSDYFLRLQRATREMTPGLEAVYYNAHLGFTLQFLPILAPLRVEDTDAIAHEKMRIVADFIDLLLKSTDCQLSSVRLFLDRLYNVSVGQGITRLRPSHPVSDLKKRVADWDEGFEGLINFEMNLQNKQQVRHILARMTYYVDQQCGVASTFEQYIDRDVKKPFEIEHIMPNKYERYLDAYATEEEFLRARSRLGNLLLLPNGFNQSLGDAPYEDKIKSYYAQNLLVRTSKQAVLPEQPCISTISSSVQIALRAA